MTAFSTKHCANLDEMLRLVASSLAGNMLPKERQRLEQLLGQDVETRNLYLDVIHESSILLTWAIHGGLGSEGAGGVIADQQEADRHRIATPLIVSSPASTFFSTAYHGTISFFSQELPFSLLIATLLTGFGLWIASLVYVSSPERVAQDFSSLPSKATFDPNLEVVGKITGMVDCKWADPNTETFHGANVLLGRKYALSSGLMEITYVTGAKVILQGPVTYEVESKNGGFLPVGKLTGKVEVEEAKGFAIRTPTATVTDLGTEFGVEVSKEGDTTSHVFRGSVELRVVAAEGKAEDSVQVLHAGKSILVKTGKNEKPAIQFVAKPSAAFVRVIPHRMPIKVFNTGKGLQEGDLDPHWQIVAASNNPAFKPQTAVVATVPEGSWAPNEPSRSQWISSGGEHPFALSGIYTFRTTFDLTGMLPKTAILRGCFLVDDFIQSMRLNGHDVPLKECESGERKSLYRQFTIDQSFVEGVNVLEVEVRNSDAGDKTKPNAMGLRVELQGSVVEK